jgi:hypothetical protein
MKLQGTIFRSETGENVTFEKAFPDIKLIDVVIDESGAGTEGLGTRCLTRRSVRETINCSNPRCLGKGLELGALIRHMVQMRQTHHALTALCQSREENNHPCANHFNMQIAITYFFR